MRTLNRKVWPYSIKIRIQADSEAEMASKARAMDLWCQQNTGVRFKEWYAYNLDMEHRTYAFKTEEELLIFKIRWNYK